MKQKKLTEEQKKNLKRKLELYVGTWGIETFEELENRICNKYALEIFEPKIDQIQPFTFDRWMARFCELFGILGVILFVTYYLTSLPFRCIVYVYRKTSNTIFFKRNLEVFKEGFDKLRSENQQNQKGI